MIIKDIIIKEFDYEDLAIFILNQNKNIIFLFGDLGVGKTTLSKYIIKKIGYLGNTTSPTFTIIKNYKVNNKDIYHLDLYRIKELEYNSLNFDIEKLSQNKNNIFLIEWGGYVIKNIKNKENVLCIYLSHDTINTRYIKIEKEDEK